MTEEKTEVEPMKPAKAWLVLGVTAITLPWVVLGIAKYFTCVYNVYF